MLIKSTNLRHAHLMDFFQVMTIVSKLLQKEDLEALKLTEAASEFEKKLSRLDNALIQARKTGYTNDIIITDQKRDDIFTGMTYIVKANTYFPQEERAKAAIQIEELISKYGGGIQKLPQREETATLTNLLQDLNLTANKQYAQTIGIEEWMIKLQEANETFEKLYTQRTEKDAKFIVGLTKKEREEMQKEFIKLCQTIDAYALIEAEEPYKQIAENINTEVAKAQQVIKTRQTLSIK